MHIISINLLLGQQACVMLIMVLKYVALKQSNLHNESLNLAGTVKAPMSVGVAAEVPFSTTFNFYPAPRPLTYFWSCSLGGGQEEKKKKKKELSIAG